MDRNSILAFALSMLVFTGWAMWQGQRQPALEPGLESSAGLLDEGRDPAGSLNATSDYEQSRRAPTRSPKEVFAERVSATRWGIRDPEDRPWCRPDQAAVG